MQDEAFVHGQAAGEKLLLEEAFQTRAILSGNGVGIVAGCAGLLIKMPPCGLLRVQTQFRVGLLRRVFRASGEESRENGGRKGEFCSALQRAIIF